MTGSFAARGLDLSTPRPKSFHAAWLASLPIAFLLVLMAVGSAAGHHGALTGAAVSPRSLTAGSTVNLAVTYTNHSGRIPSIVAIVGRTTVPMTAASGDVKTGLRFVASTVPPAGRHAVRFVASDGHDATAAIEAGYIVVAAKADPTAPPAKPRPTAPPVSRTKQDPDSDSDSKPVAGGTAAPGTVAGATGAPNAPARDSGDPGAPELRPAVAGDPDDPGDASDQPAVQPANAAVAAGAASTGGGGRGSGGSGGSGAVILPITPVGGVDPLAQYRHAPLTTLVMELLPTIATATSGGAAWAAFVLFGKRRRDDDDDNLDTRLAGEAASGVDTGAAQGFNAVDESQLPRWRRPSLQQVRRADPLRQAAEAAPTLSFEGAGVRPLESRERRRIGYRLVRLLDSPDEVRAAEIGILDRGDEVQLLERYGVYWRVLCPDGRTGWVHRMTLTELGAESGQGAPAIEDELEDVDRAALVQGAAEVGEAAPEPAVDGFLNAYLRAHDARDGQGRSTLGLLSHEPAPAPPEAAAEPVATPAPEPIAEIAAAPIAEIAAAPVEAPKRPKVAAPRSKPKLTLKRGKKPAEPEPAPAAAVEAVAEPVAPEPVEIVELVDLEGIAEPPTEPVQFEAIAEPAVEAIAEPIEPEAIAEPIELEAVAEPVVEPEAIAEPVLEPEAIAEPIELEAVAEPVVEPEAIAEPVVEAVAEPVAEAVAEPVVEPEAIAGPMVEAVAEPVVEPEAIAEPVQPAAPIAVTPRLIIFGVEEIEEIEAVAEPVESEAIAEPVDEAVAEAAAEPAEIVAIAEAVAEPAEVEAVAEPVVEPEAVAEPVEPEATAQPIVWEPVEVEAVALVVAEPAPVEPEAVAEPAEIVVAAEPAGEAVAEPVVEVVARPIAWEPVEVEAVAFVVSQPVVEPEAAAELIEPEAVAEPVEPEAVAIVEVVAIVEPVETQVSERADPREEHAGLSAAELAVALAHDYLEQAGFLVQAPHDPAQADIPIFAPVLEPDEAVKSPAEPEPESPAEPS